ncbi:MAG: cupin domain-containing protein [Methylotenera sp.]
MSGTVAQDKVVAGVAGHAVNTIHTEILNHYADPTEQFFAGIWQSRVGAKSVNYTEEEVCVILEGCGRLTNLTGNAKEFGAGSTFRFTRRF